MNMEMIDTLLTSTNQPSIKIAIRNNKKPIILNGMTLRTAYNDKKYHSGIM
jgi:hypothetical protein